MKKAICKICGKEIEGFTDKDLKYRKIMHSMTHRDKEKKEKGK